MKPLTSTDTRITFFFNSLQLVSNKLDNLFKNYTPLFNGERYITDDDLAKRLNLHRRTLADYRKDGVLPYIPLGGKVLYKESDIINMLEASYTGNGNSTLSKQ